MLIAVKSLLLLVISWRTTAIRLQELQWNLSTVSFLSIKQYTRKKTTLHQNTCTVCIHTYSYGRGRGRGKTNKQKKSCISISSLLLVVYFSPLPEVFWCDAEYKTKQFIERKNISCKPISRNSFALVGVSNLISQENVGGELLFFKNNKLKRPSYPPSIPAPHLPLGYGCLLNWVTELTTNLAKNK